MYDALKSAGEKSARRVRSVAGGSHAETVRLGEDDGVPHSVRRELRQTSKR